MKQEQKDLMKRTNAFYWVSFDPEKRMENFINRIESVQENIKELCCKYGVEDCRILEKHFNLTMAYLNSQARCMSWAITGPARFPVQTQTRRHNNTEVHLNKLVDFENNIEKLLRRITRKNESEDDKKTKWIQKVNKLKEHQEMMKDVNKLIRQGKQSEAEEKYGKLKKNFWGNYGFEPYELRNNLANIKHLEEQIKQIDKARELKMETGFCFVGGRVEFDDKEIRYNIFFDTIPEQEIRLRLKQNGFKWSPKRLAWTRGAKTINIERIKNILNIQ